MRFWKVGIVLALGACAAPPRVETAPAMGLFTGRRVVGRSVQGRPIEAVAHGVGPETTLIIASIHGSEPAGTPLIEALIERLEREAPRRRVVIVPVANPDGFEKRRRHNANGVDLNRNFPADNRVERRRHGHGALSEPEAAALHDLILDQCPEAIVSIHQPIACVDYDGPAESLARRMAEACGLPVRKLGARPGSLGAWAGETLGIATVTLELPRGVERLDRRELWRRYGGALRAAIESP